MLYPSNFGVAIVSRLAKKYSDAFERLIGLYGMKFRDVVRIFLTDQHRYYRFRQCVKYVNRLTSCDDITKNPIRDDQLKAELMRFKRSGYPSNYQVIVPYR